MHKDAGGNWVADLDPAADAAPVRSDTAANAVPPPPPPTDGPALVDPEAAGFALPAGVAASRTAGPAPSPRARRGGRNAVFAAIAIAAVVILVKLLLFFGVARVISLATTYHEPATISGDMRSTNATVVATVNQLKDGIQLPALQGGHTEGAGYTDTRGNLDYLFVLAQDNANSDSARPGVNMTSLFGGVEGTHVSPTTTSRFNGINLECATVTDISGSTSVPLNACDWYDTDAFGLFVDYKSSSLDATKQLEASLLTTMTK